MKDDEYSISGDELDDDDDDVEDEFDDRELVCTLCGNIDDVFTCSKAKCGKVYVITLQNLLICIK